MTPYVVLLESYLVHYSQRLVTSIKLSYTQSCLVSDIVLYRSPARSLCYLLTIVMEWLDDWRWIVKYQLNCFGVSGNLFVVSNILTSSIWSCGYDLSTNLTAGKNCYWCLWTHWDVWWILLMKMLKIWKIYDEFWGCTCEICSETNPDPGMLIIFG